MSRFASSLLAATCLTGLLTLFCEPQDESPVVAQVGDATLTLQQLEQSIPPEYAAQVRRDQKISNVKRWIDQELLYQEALRQKLHRTKTIRSRLEKMEKELLCAELLNKAPLNDKQLQISDEMIRNYFEKNRELFVRDQDVFRFMQIVVNDYQQALTIRSRVQGDNFADLAAENSIVPLEDARSISYMKADAIPSALVATLGALPVGATTAPIKTEQGYHIVQLIDKQPQGSSCTVDEVRNEIVQKLSSTLQKQKTEEYLSSLRLKTVVTHSFDHIPRDQHSEPDSAQ
jgi:peptidyl-prolyl cis-trans isomerase C